MLPCSPTAILMLTAPPVRAFASSKVGKRLRPALALISCTPDHHQSRSLQGRTGALETPRACSKSDPVQPVRLLTKLFVTRRESDKSSASIQAQSAGSRPKLESSFNWPRLGLCTPSESRGGPRTGQETIEQGALFSQGREEPPAALESGDCTFQSRIYVETASQSH